MSCLNDDQFKTNSDKKMPQPGFLQNFLLWISMPFIIIFLLIKISFFRSDSEAAKIGNLKGGDDFKNKYYASQEQIPFESIKKCYKRFEKVSFNDYICGIISVNMRKWYKDYGIDNPEKLLTFIPINTRNLPTKIEELDLYNKAVGMKFELPLVENFESAIKQSSTSFKSIVSMPRVLAIDRMASIMYYLPTFFTKKTFVDFYKRIDFGFTNVPLSKEPWYI